MKKKLLSWIKLIFINSIIILILLLIIENFLIDIPLTSQIQLNDSRSIYLREHKPNSLQKFNNLWLSDNFENAIYKPLNILKTDEEGFIIGPNIIEEYEKTIFFLGGSTTECAYVDHDKRFPYLVQRNLRDHKIKTINGGVGGQNSKQGFLSFITKGIKQKPDFLILMFNINDISILTKTGSYDSGVSGRSLIIDKKQNKSLSMIDIMKSFKNKMFPKIWFFIRKNILGYENYLIPNDEFEGFRNKKFEKNYVLDHFKRSILNYVMYCKINDIHLILMSQFNNIENKSEIFLKGFSKLHNSYSVDEFVDIYSKSNELIKEIAKDYNVSFIDLNKLIPKKGEYIFDSVHLTDKGSILVSEIITNHLKEIIQ